MLGNVKYLWMSLQGIYEVQEQNLFVAKSSAPLSIVLCSISG